MLTLQVCAVVKNDVHFFVPILYLAPSLPGIGLSSPGARDLHGMRISRLGGAKVCCMYQTPTPPSMAMHIQVQCYAH